MTNFWHACEDTLFPFKTCTLITVLWTAPFEIETPTTIQALSCFLFPTNVTYLARVSWTDPNIKKNYYLIWGKPWDFVHFFKIRTLIFRFFIFYYYFFKIIFHVTFIWKNISQIYWNWIFKGNLRKNSLSVPWSQLKYCQFHQIFWMPLNKNSVQQAES